jgi:hypothetical protein
MATPAQVASVSVYVLAFALPILVTVGLMPLVVWTTRISRKRIGAFVGTTAIGMTMVIESLVVPWFIALMQLALIPVLVWAILSGLDIKRAMRRSVARAQRLEQMWTDVDRQVTTLERARRWHLISPEEIKEREAALMAKEQERKREIEGFATSPEFAKMSRYSKRWAFLLPHLPTRASLQRILVALYLVYAIVPLAFPLLSSSPWIPAERVRISNGASLTGYVVAEGSWMTILTERDRKIVMLRPEEVTGRAVCLVPDQFLSAPTVWQLMESGTRMKTPDCPKAS